MTEYTEEILRSFGKFTPNMVSEIRRATLLEVAELCWSELDREDNSAMLRLARELERMAGN